MKLNAGHSIANGLRGVCIGIANTIPGVSGGTIAVVVGVYDELIFAVSNVLTDRGRRRHHLLVLLPVVVGVLAGILGFARVIDYFMTTRPDETVFFFIGLILGGVPFLLRKTTAPSAAAGEAAAEDARGTAGDSSTDTRVDVPRPRRRRFSPWYLVPFGISFVLLLFMAFAERPAPTAPITELTLLSAVAVFATGVISAATMVIPGVSGSFVLLLIGMYSTFIAAARDANAAVLGVFLIGAVSGIALVSRLIAYLLRRFHGYAYSAILGLVLGSVFMLWPEITGDTSLIGAALAVPAGAAAALLLGSGRKERLLAAQSTDNRVERGQG